MVLDELLERDVIGTLDLEHEEHSGEIRTRQADWVDEVWIGIGTHGEDDALPMLHRVPSNSNGNEGIALEVETVGGLLVALQVDDVFIPQVGGKLDGVLTSSITFKHNQSGIVGRDGEGYPRMATLADESLADKGAKVGRRQVNEDEGQVGEAQHADRRHEDFDGVRLQLLLQFLLAVGEGVIIIDIGVDDRPPGQTRTVGSHPPPGHPPLSH